MVILIPKVGMNDMIALVTDCTSALTALLANDLYSYVCYGALIFGFLICLISFLRGYI